MEATNLIFRMLYVFILSLFRERLTPENKWAIRFDKRVLHGNQRGIRLD